MPTCKYCHDVIDQTDDGDWITEDGWVACAARISQTHEPSGPEDHGIPVATITLDVR